MRDSIYTKNSKKLSIEKCERWRRITFSIAAKIWVLLLIVELFLFIFFKPTSECDKAYYLYLFVARPAIAQGLTIIICKIVLILLLKTRNLYVMSLCTMLEASILVGITACVHTSVVFMPIVLLFPMILTPLYRDKRLTILQLILSCVIYIIDRVYFIPNSPYMPEGNSLIDVTIFFASAIVIYILIEQVNVSFLLQDEKVARDSLTHLYNHETFYEELEYYMKSYAEDKKGFSVWVADIDNFKQVNDTYGHAFGDDVIRQVVKVMKKSCDKNTFCARYGGEEFAVILPGKKIEEAGSVAERVRKEFEQHEFETIQGTRHFTLSIGVAEYDRDYQMASEFFEEADRALYEAKRSGKNRVCYAKTGE